MPCRHACSEPTSPEEGLIYESPDWVHPACSSLMAATAPISIFVININYSEREMAQILNINQGQLNSEFYHGLISCFLGFTYFILLWMYSLF